MTTPHHGRPLQVQRLQTVPADLVDSFYELYRVAFEPLRTLAAARHVLSPAEFAEEMPTSASTSTWPSPRTAPLWG